MDYNIEVEHMIEKIRTLSGSYGTAPYTVTVIPFSRDIQQRFKQIGLEISADYLLIAIFVWTDYSAQDMKDFVCLSAEFISLPEEEQQVFLTERLSVFKNPADKNRWIEKQVSLAIGIINYVGFNNHLEVVQVPDFMIEDFASVVPAGPDLKLYSLAFFKRNRKGQRDSG